MFPSTSHPSARPRRRSGGRRRTAVAVAALVAGASLAACQPAGPTVRHGLWTSRAELAVLPTSGAAWQRVLTTARGSWGTPSLADNNATHDTSTLAGALVAVRTGDPAMLAKTRASIMSVTRITSFSRVLELSRNIPAYVIAADLVGLPAQDDATFRAYISRLRTRPLSGHSGGTDLVSTALRSPNNWGAMARAAVTSIDLYLGDRTQLNQIANAHRAWLGESVPNQLVYSSTRWHAPGAKAGINRRGAVVAGRSADGVLPEDQRRTGEPTSAPAPKGTYPWEALQGAVVTGVLLDRAGIVDINAGDHALARASAWLTHVNQNPASGDDTWQPWVLNATAGTRLATVAASSPGKNMAWSDWTHA